ncbi:1-acyl-sn-glycerol-3-phosphate acyltransferase [Flammeovirga sp. SubArs3]|uniref:1-acyl-sn-glycerol-3-phosphate acyltransferase n=1 Tax=Flammeovirga sp. SubArs3 TaxID=2995316 RepID=UPI00248BE4D5|nr:1-acyl-sn-glycerol-3-phosphate acyltransferase [Flammeovirga sp. SubArs3]
MNLGLYSVVKNLIKYLYLKFVFYKIEKNGWENIPDNKPIIFAVTHPLMYVDAVVLGCSFNRPLHFITKSTVFNTKFKRWLFGKMNMIPVVRKQDGPKGGKFSNKDMFINCIKTLEQNNCILIFSEGTSIWERKLRELKTGTARIALEAENENDFNLGVHIVPVALNYTYVTSYFPSVSIDVAPAIDVHQYKEQFKENPSLVAKEITTTIRERILERYFTIEDSSHEDLIKDAVVMYNETPKEGWSRKNSLKKYFDRLIAAEHIIQNTKDQSTLNALKENIINYNHQLKKRKIQDFSLWKTRVSWTAPITLLLRMALHLVVLPIQVSSWLFNYVPYKFSKFLAQKTSKEVEVWGANLIVFLAFFFSITYLITIGVIHYFYPLSWWVRIVLLVLFPFFTYVSFFMHETQKKLFSDVRLAYLSYNKKNEFNSIATLRERIISDINTIIEATEDEEKI